MISMMFLEFSRYIGENETDKQEVDVMASLQSRKTNNSASNKNISEIICIDTMPFSCFMQEYQIN